MSCYTAVTHTVNFENCAAAIEGEPAQAGAQVEDAQDDTLPLAVAETNSAEAEAAAQFSKLTVWVTAV